MANKEKFRTNTIVTTVDLEGEKQEYYPTGAEELDDMIESFKQSIYSNDIVKFDVEYNSKDAQDKVRIRHKLTYTSFDGEPVESQRELEFGKNI